MARSPLVQRAHAAAAYSGIESEMGQAAYVHEEVFRAINTGVFTETVALEPMEVEPEFVQMAFNGNPGPDYAEAVWRNSPNHSSRPSGAKGDETMVIIHTCEGSYSGCWSWLSSICSPPCMSCCINPCWQRTSSGSNICRRQGIRSKRNFNACSSYLIAGVRKISPRK